MELRQIVSLIALIISLISISVSLWALIENAKYYRSLRDSFDDESEYSDYDGEDRNAE